MVMNPNRSHTFIVEIDLQGAEGEYCTIEACQKTALYVCNVHFFE